MYSQWFSVKFSESKTKTIWEGYRPISVLASGFEEEKHKTGDRKNIYLVTKPKKPLLKILTYAMQTWWDQRENNGIKGLSF